MAAPSKSDFTFLREALRLAARAHEQTSPNPLVGAVLVKHGKIIGRGWHRRAGLPHAEIEALRDCEQRDHSPRGATLYVTLEPCCTHGRTPPCTEAIIAAGIKRVVVAARDPIRVMPDADSSCCDALESKSCPASWPTKQRN